MEAKSLAYYVHKFAEDKKAEDVVALDMRKVCDFCDYFFICSATSTRHAKAISDGITEGLKKKRVRPWHAEGAKEGSWIILDYNFVIVHIFSKETRSFYKLERLWGDASHVDFSKFKRKTKCKKSPLKKVSPS